MSKEKKNTISEALLEMDSIKKAITENSKNTLKLMLGDVVKDVMRESIEKDEKEDKDEYEVVDTEKDEKEEEKSGDVSEDVDDELGTDTPAEKVPQDGMADAQADNAQEAPVEGEGEGSEDEWSNYSQYKVGDDNTYDLTGEEDINQIVKVYKLMKNDDNVLVKQEGDTIQLTDNETGNEYVIDLSSDSTEGEMSSQEPVTEGVKDIAGFSDDEDEDEVEFELSDEDSEDDEEPRFENKKSNKVMKENKELVFEVDLGYTDNYQDKDAIAGLSTAKPSKEGKSWEKGVPTGTAKPWAGDSKSKGKPFEKTVNEEDENLEECGGNVADVEPTVEEGTNVGGAVQQRSTSKSHIPAGRKEFGPKVKHHVSTEGNYEEVVENYKKEISKLKKMNEAYKRENVELKKFAKKLGESVNESYVVNNNLAKLTKLFTENVISLDERKEIVNRFVEEGKTVEKSNALYESINNELKKNTKSITLENTQVMSAEPSETLNENKKSKELLQTLDLIKRIEL